MTRVIFHKRTAVDQQHAVQTALQQGHQPLGPDGSHRTHDRLQRKERRDAHQMNGLIVPVTDDDDDDDDEERTVVHWLRVGGDFTWLQGFDWRMTSPQEVFLTAEELLRTQEKSVNIIYLMTSHTSDSQTADVCVYFMLSWTHDVTVYIIHSENINIIEC